VLLRKWEDLPPDMQCEEVRYYYDILSLHKTRLVLKRIFDVVMSLLFIVLLSPLFLAIALVIAADSPGGVFFRQIRVTSYGKRFVMFKFRTMVVGADKAEAAITVDNDARITRAGRFIRRFRLDEIPQLFNVLSGDMTFVGTRPEVEKYVEQYTAPMKATLLLPAGVTSIASIYYKNEGALLSAAKDIDRVYVEKVLPGKMYYNLKAIEEFGFFKDIGIMVKTVLAVLGASYSDEKPNTPKADKKAG